MSAPEFTPNGVEIQSLQDIVDELVQGYKDIYGQDINVEPESPDGQRIGIEAKARADLQAWALKLYNDFDPDLASGERLRRIIKWAGLTQRPASRSQADLEVTTDQPVTLPAEWTVADDLGREWRTDQELSLPQGTTTVTVFAQEFGALESAADTITEIVTVVRGVTNVTNPAAATVGQDEETAAELRRRRNRSLLNPATSTAGGLFTALADLSDVTDVAVYENDQDTTDTTRNIAPHTIWPIVEGGAVADIVEIIAKNKTGGTGLKGAVTGTYTEELQKPNGDTYSIIHEMQFDRPVSVDLYIRVTITAKESGDPVDGDQVESNLVTQRFTIAQEAIASEMYEAVYDAGSNFVATGLEVSLDGTTWTDTSVDPGFDGKFSVAPANVTVTGVT